YDAYYDIKGAIEKMIELGYTKVHLQGHSLGCTKIIYTYNRLKEENYDKLSNIKSVILLSLVDIPGLQKHHTGEENYYKCLEYAKMMKAQNREKELMPKESFMHPISIETYWSYFGENNKKLDFAKFDDFNYDYKEINNIEIPLLLRWGNVNEFIKQDLTQLIPFLKNKIDNCNLDINYIDGADHSYFEKEEILAEQILKFISK
ncbi:MAG: alpha/beta hydrolase, partial [Oscillospiraceae bacterium]|nr:alpha/beta hydrolase [Oscillospiraceae bacterium]